jgi:hypothetical protein
MKFAFYVLLILTISFTFCFSSRSFMKVKEENTTQGNTNNSTSLNITIDPHCEDIQTTAHKYRTYTEGKLGSLLLVRGEGSGEIFNSNLPSKWDIEIIVGSFNQPYGFKCENITYKDGSKNYTGNFEIFAFPLSAKYKIQVQNGKFNSYYSGLARFNHETNINFRKSLNPIGKADFDFQLRLNAGSASMENCLLEKEKIDNCSEKDSNQINAFLEKVVKERAEQQISGYLGQLYSNFISGK